VVFDLLSERGKRFFFPTQGILAQGAEAKQKAKVANATIGIAVEHGVPAHLACVDRYFSGLTPGDIYDYAPSYGKPELRQAWARKQREETPSLGGRLLSNPVVTNALTHGLSVVGELFLDPGDEVLSSDLLWENYNLAWETRLGAHISYFPFFDPHLTGYNLEALTQALAHRAGEKLVVSLNFPNNPSGYTPTRAEALGIVAALTGVECRRPEFTDCWDVYPYNSGYFMCLRLKGADADQVRRRLLDEHGVGTIALGPANLRVAFSCLTEEQIPGVFRAIAAAVRAVTAGQREGLR
jgi:aspartate/methionine/tyrosine aminotransferase